MSDLEKMAEDFVQTWCLLPEEEWNSVDSKKDLLAEFQKVQDKAIEDCALKFLEVYDMMDVMDWSANEIANEIRALKDPKEATVDNNPIT